jgi:branched-chain amino acid transport system substrate-binding protein
MNRRDFLRASAGIVLLPAAKADEKQTIKIVSSLPRQGAAKGQTDGIVNGIALAVERYKGILPFEVKYLDLDDATATDAMWTAVREEENARAAVRDDEVMALIGPYNSGAAKVSAPVLNKAGLVQISPATTWPGLTKKTDETAPGEPDVYRPSGKVTYCRVCPTDDVQGSITAAFAAKDLKVKSVYVLDDREGYGKMVARLFAAECKKRGIKVLGQESLDLRQPSFNVPVAKAMKTEPDAVYFGGTTQSGGPQLAKDFAAAGMKCPLFVPDGCYEEAFITAAGAENLNVRCFVSCGGFDPSKLNERGVAFVKQYKARFKHEPQHYAFYAFDAAAAVLEAIKTVGKRDREAVRKAVLATKDFDKGVLDRWGFDENGDTTLQQATILKIEKGKFTPVKVLTAGKE